MKCLHCNSTITDYTAGDPYCVWCRPNEWSLVREGDLIRLDEMPNDPCPVEVGTTGTVTAVKRPVNQIDVKWNAPRSLALVPGDRFTILARAFVIQEEL